jgi:hypothetical protein
VRHDQRFQPGRGRGQWCCFGGRASREARLTSFFGLGVIDDVEATVARGAAGVVGLLLGRPGRASRSLRGSRRWPACGSGAAAAPRARS